MTESSRKQTELELAAHRATAALKEFKIKNKNSSKASAPKPASTRAKTPKKPKGA